MSAISSIERIRQEISAVFRDELGHDLIISERAGIVLENLYYDTKFSSWQLKLLNSLFQTTPAIYQQLVEVIPNFNKFDYEKLSNTIAQFGLRAKENETTDSRTIYQQLVEVIPNFNKFDYEKLSNTIAQSRLRSKENETTDFRTIVKHLLEEPDSGEIAVVRMTEYNLKKEIISNVLTVDHLVLLLFWVLYAGQYFSDIAMALLELDGRELHFGRVNRWYLDELEGIYTETEVIDSSYSSQQWVLFHDGAKFRVRPFGAWGINQLQETPLKDGSLWIARGNVLQPPTRFSEEKIVELEYLVNRKALERDFQDFFERNPEFLLALGGYRSLHSQLILHEDDGRRLIPDFFLEKLNSDFCDILDLKRAKVQISRRQKGRNRFRDAIMEGIAQLAHYKDWFEDKNNRQEFYSRYGLNAYRPKVVLIIGRNEDIFDEIEQIRVRDRLPTYCEIKTYDQVIDSAKHYLKLITKG